MQKIFEKILEMLEDFKHWEDDSGRPIHTFSEVQRISKCKEIVQEVAKEYNNGWIPCSERLPEEELEKAMRERGENAVFPVLATINKVHLISGEKYKIVSRAFYGQYNDKNFYNSCCDRLDVIAWQPLPEPYQPKGE